VIITKTPFRISFLGGGSDLKEYYGRSPGAVLSITINKHMYISSHRFFEENQTRVKYSQTETVGSIDDIKHPIVRTVLKRFGFQGGLEISSIADVPSGTGLGSSSAFTVGFLHNYYARSGKFVTCEQLAREACEIEIDMLKEPIGRQDQYAAAFGGLNVIHFHTDGQVSVDRLHLGGGIIEKLQQNLLMFYTGKSRATSSVLLEQKENIAGTAGKFEAMRSIVDLVEQGREVLYSGELNDFGRLLDKGWIIKRELASKVTDPEIDAIYEHALRSGALGGKLLGAGGGGFLLFYCEKHKQDALRSALSKLKELPFQFELEGSKVIYVGSE